MMIPRKITKGSAMPKGGKREGAGRKKTGKISTKLTVYIETREKFNELAKSFQLTVSELMEKISEDEGFLKYLTNLLKR